MEKKVRQKAPSKEEMIRLVSSNDPALIQRALDLLPLFFRAQKRARLRALKKELAELTAHKK